MKTAYFYIHEGFADWEGGFILPRLNKPPFKVKTAAESPMPLTSMGGLRVAPDLILEDVNLDETAVFILPGGNSWMDADANPGVMKLLPRLREREIPIASICAATLAFARLGFLDQVRHTSNGPDFIESIIPGYRGQGLYSDALAVSDQNVITASGIGALEFAYEIMKVLNVCDEKTARQWFDLFKHAVIPPPEFWVNQ
ncbi:MAG: glutamine amidotransferase [Firmicutes bacterium]|nr:glutamine amidotransferase [Bacillota bacterium]